MFSLKYNQYLCPEIEINFIFYYRYLFFQHSKVPTYQQMWAYMENAKPSVFVKNIEDGKLFLDVCVHIQRLKSKSQ